MRPSGFKGPPRGRPNRLTWTAHPKKTVLSLPYARLDSWSYQSLEGPFLEQHEACVSELISRTWAWLSAALFLANRSLFLLSLFFFRPFFSQNLLSLLKSLAQLIFSCMFFRATTCFDNPFVNVHSQRARSIGACIYEVDLPIVFSQKSWTSKFRARRILGQALEHAMVSTFGAEKSEGWVYFVQRLVRIRTGKCWGLHSYHLRVSSVFCLVGFPWQEFYGLSILLERGFASAGALRLVYVPGRQGWSAW